LAARVFFLPGAPPLFFWGGGGGVMACEQHNLTNERHCPQPARKQSNVVNPAFLSPKCQRYGTLTTTDVRNPRLAAEKCLGW